MSNLGRLHLPMRKPEDVIPHLKKGELHWRDGYSAKSAAERWFQAAGFPDEVRAVLDQAEEYRGCTLLEGWFERETELPWGRGRPTQTDLLTLVRTSDYQLAVVGIEAKVKESFGPLVGDWLEKGGDNKRQRLVGLCSIFGIEAEAAVELRYQLFHRVAGSWLEARRFGVSRAAMLVHSFCPDRTGFADFESFSEAAGFGPVEPNGVSAPRLIDRVEMRIGWVCG